MFKRYFTAFGIFNFLLVGIMANQPQSNQAQRQDDSLKVGDVAPNWQLPGSDGKTYQLSDYKGKKTVVVAWYPAALTGG